MKKYEKIVNVLRQQIIDQIYQEGDRLPSEEEIAHQFQVSRMTANKALNLLQKERIIRRVKGNGSFVSTKSLKTDIVASQSFEDEMKELGLKASKRLIDYRLFKAATLPTLMEKMKLHEDDLIHYMIRVMLADDMEIAVGYSYITPKYLDEVDLNAAQGSLYSLLRSKGAKFKYADFEMTAMLPTEEQKELLKIFDEALLKSSTWLYDQDDELIEFTEMFYVGSKYNYYFHIDKLKEE